MDERDLNKITATNTEFYAGQSSVDYAVTDMGLGCQDQVLRSPQAA